MDITTPPRKGGATENTLAKNGCGARVRETVACTAAAKPEANLYKHTHTHTPPSHTRQDQASGDWRQSVGNMMTPPPFSQMRDLPKGSSPWRGAVETVGPGEVTSRAVPSPHSTPPSFTGAPSKLPHCIQGLPALPHRHACAHSLPFTHPGLADLRVRIAHGWSAGHSALPAAVLSPDLHSGLLPPHPGSPFPGQGRKSFHPPTGTKPYVEELTAGPGMATLDKEPRDQSCCGVVVAITQITDTISFNSPLRMGEFS